MDCPVCKGKIQIKRSFNKIENDNTPDTPTQAYTMQEMACMNDKCSQYGVVVDTVKHEIEFE